MESSDRERDYIGALAVMYADYDKVDHRTRIQAYVPRDIGGLMSFGADGPAAFRHGAKFVQRILQGKQPKDIP